MPIYEYVCQKCGHHLEVMQKMSDKPLTRCPECRGKLEKVISQTSFQLKGSGWYVSDYGKGGTKAATDKTSKSDSAKTDKAEKSTKSDSSSDSSKSDKPGKKEATAGSTPSSSGSTTKSD